MFDGISDYEYESLELDIDTKVCERRIEDAVRNKENEILVITPKPVPSSIGKRIRTHQATVKKSVFGSSLSRDLRLEFLKNQKVLGGRTFNPTAINTTEIKELLEMVKFQNWEHLFTFSVSYVYEEEVKVFLL